MRTCPGTTEVSDGVRAGTTFPSPTKKKRWNAMPVWAWVLLIVLLVLLVTGGFGYSRR